MKGIVGDMKRREKTMSEKLLLKIADKLKEKGREYYDKAEVNKTAIFWELESIIRKVVREEKVKQS